MNFIFDIDGTICFKGEPVSQLIQEELLKLREQGHVVGFASARPCRDMLPVLDKRLHDCLMIGANGAMTYYNHELVQLNFIPQSILEQLISMSSKHKASYLIDLAWDYHYAGDRSHPFLAKVDPSGLAASVNLTTETKAAKFLVTSCMDAAALQQDLAALPITIHHHSDEEIVDITAEAVDKMVALRQFGIQEGQFICFGNDTNDLPMFCHAAYSVMIGDHLGLQKIASEQIRMGSDTEDQILTALSRFSTEAATSH
ncbi:HAD family hydrolase [Paenibacillus sp. UMB4589-SE434]|uniref:HAD-IIB family hydrolase n=1 Tax=Paenibacillus sp. UMB4589-SE434 TaxID=3046314 RepID=UPI00254E2418|nr:HAD family hydrolase [Paenibacillus sp. UMB4589-SE434]MDK8183624.1 HAD family hydrolase [Paenibacillus sp. UMB4589-SE434]